MLRRAAFSPNIKERADCSAALFDADRRAAGAGRAHPRPPRVDAGVGAGPPSTPSATPWSRATRSCSTTPSTAAPTSTTSPSSPPASSTAACWAGPPTGPTTPTSAAWRRARSPPRPPRSTRRACASRPSCSPPTSRTCCCANSRTPDERRGDLDAQRGANVVGRRAAGRRSPAAPLDEVTDYGERRMRAALADIPDGTWSFEDVLDSCRPDARPAAPGQGRRDPHHRGRHGHVRLHRHRPPAARQRQRGRGGHRQRGVVRPAVRHRPDHPGQRRRPAPGHRDRPGRHAGGGHSPRRRSAPATSRSASGWPTSAWAPSPPPSPAAWARPTRGR